MTAAVLRILSESGQVWKVVGCMSDAFNYLPFLLSDCREYFILWSKIFLIR